ncbi:hypothetical protein EVAR_67775_1 [Eumeta japonica]|uniref:Uncharacterized protein n=1 Tax=Eumeta variegata TaxID=151549 RepID=A0A4C1ZZJ4_EUMVA|nr:hypothetical protein EVAR_67775_1 [Eumeta japonica]
MKINRTFWSVYWIADWSPQCKKLPVPDLKNYYTTKRFQLIKPKNKCQLPYVRDTGCAGRHERTKARVICINYAGKLDVGELPRPAAGARAAKAALVATRARQWRPCEIYPQRGPDGAGSRIRSNLSFLYPPGRPLCT